MNPLLDAAEAGAILWPNESPDRRRRRCYEWAARGVFPREIIVRVGRAVFLKSQALDDWLKGHPVTGNGIKE